MSEAISGFSYSAGRLSICIGCQCQENKPSGDGEFSCSAVVYLGNSRYYNLLTRFRKEKPSKEPVIIDAFLPEIRTQNGQLTCSDYKPVETLHSDTVVQNPRGVSVA